jgi:hypothetical protein
LCGAALRKRGRDQTGRHILMKRDCAADRRAHRCKSRTAEKSAAARFRFASEHDRVRALGVVAIKFVNRSFDLVASYSISCN